MPLSISGTSIGSVESTIRSIQQNNQNTQPMNAINDLPCHRGGEDDFKAHKRERGADAEPAKMTY